MNTQENIDNITRVICDATTQFERLPPTGSSAEIITAALHSLSSTASLLEDVEITGNPAANALQVLGQISGSYMRGIETLDADRQRRERAYARQETIKRVIFWLLVLSALINLVLGVLLVTKR